MKIGLIDVDGHNYPNLPLMKLSAWHKARGDSVEWYEPKVSGHLDIVYMSKVFSFTKDYPHQINADKIVKGGSGYAISLVDGKEVYDKSADSDPPCEIEHIYPDHSFDERHSIRLLITRVSERVRFLQCRDKGGQCSVKVADLTEFRRGQKNIVLCDPNLLACSEWRDLLQQLIDSKSYIDIDQRA